MARSRLHGSSPAWVLHGSCSAIAPNRVLRWVLLGHRLSCHVGVWHAPPTPVAKAGLYLQPQRSRDPHSSPLTQGIFTKIVAGGAEVASILQVMHPAAWP